MKNLMQNIIFWETWNPFDEICSIDQSITEGQCGGFPSTKTCCSSLLDDRVAGCLITAVDKQM